MSRSFSLAPGGWVKEDDDKSGDKKKETNALERKKGKDKDKSDTTDLIRLLSQVDSQNATYPSSWHLNAHQGIAMQDSGSRPFSIEHGNSFATNSPQSLKPSDESTSTAYQIGGYQPSITDFIEGSNLAGVPDKPRSYYHGQAASPLAHHDGQHRRQAAQVYSFTPQSSQAENTSSSLLLRKGPNGFMPTPPESPFKFTSNGISHIQSPGTQGHVRYPSSSGTPMRGHMASPLTGQKSGLTPDFGNTYIGSSLIQEMSFDESPKVVVPSQYNIDPFIDQAENNIREPQRATGSGAIMLHSSFKPSRALLDEPRTILPGIAFIAKHVGIDVDGNYKGDITKEHIYNAIAPISDNCALHIIGLPADITLREIFSVIVGKVFSFQLHEPIPGKWSGCGARLVFTNRAAAEHFFLKARTGLGIIVRGHQVRVLWNRDPCRPQNYADRHQSRVLQISGPKTPLFSAEGVEAFFAKNLLFTLVDRKEWVEASGTKVVELHFPSILGQSRPAMKQFYEMLDETDQRSIFKIQYAVDPCELGAPNASSWPGFRFPNPLAQ